MVKMTYEEAKIAFEKEVSCFEAIDKEYLLKSDEFLYALEKYIFDESNKREDTYKQIKNKYITKQLAIFEEKIEFSELFARTFEIQKLYKRENKKIAFEIKQIVLKKLLKFVKSDIGKVILLVIISKIDINDSSEEKKNLISYISENWSEILIKIKKPITKAIMHGEKFKLKPIGNYSNAIKILLEEIPTFGYEFDVLCKNEICNYLFENSDIQQNILTNISEKYKKIFIEYFGLYGKTPKSFEEIAKTKMERKSTIINNFISGMKKLKNSLKK